ncbi:MAG: hypothetical protein M0P70_00260 [Desulfobulbaceae bacterium]|nr:hypothetical protein [Desulfobulbaceae bacterium]
MKKTICLFLTLAFAVPILSFAATPNFQKGQTTAPQMQQYFEGRKAEYNQYLVALAAYNLALAEQQAWDNQKNREDQAQQRTQARLQAAIDQTSQKCSLYLDPKEREACYQAVIDMKNQMYAQAADYAAYRRVQDLTRPVVGPKPTFYDNTAELDKAYIFDENQVLQEKLNVVGERNMTDEQGNKINNEEDVRDFYERNYGGN